MKYFFAPMHGITDYIYRNIVWKYFPYWDKLYAPFIQPNEKPVIVPKEYQDICPDNNRKIPTVPQILTCDAADFIRAGMFLEECGYREINLNLGCPARIVVSKGKGAGMLKDSNALDAFFDSVFSHNWNSKITVKTRLGLTEDDHFEDLLQIYRKYPISELIIHPRFRSDWYNGIPRTEEFLKVLSIADADTLPFKICYNGNVNTKGEALAIAKNFPFLDSIMCGRGALANPGLIRELCGGEPVTFAEFQAFHDDILHSYTAVISTEKHLLNKMMEMWTYWSRYFHVDNRLFAKLRHSESIKEYLSIMDEINRSLQE